MALLITPPTEQVLLADDAEESAIIVAGDGGVGVARGRTEVLPGGIVRQGESALNLEWTFTTTPVQQHIGGL